MSNASSSGRVCYLGLASRAPIYRVLSQDANWVRAITTRDMCALENEIYLPSDMSVAQALATIEAEDPSLTPGSLEASARASILAIADLPTTAWTTDHLKFIANGTLDKPLHDPPSRVFDGIVHLSTTRPKKNIREYGHEHGPRDNLGSVVFETVDGEPVLVQRFQEKCCEPGCPDRTFRNGQLTAFDELGNWRHASLAHRATEGGPVAEWTGICTRKACQQPFGTDSLITTQLTGRYPIHGIELADGSVTNCASPSMQ